MEIHMNELFDYAAAKSARDDGINLVLENSQKWSTRAYIALAVYCKNNIGAEVIGEDIRREISAQGIIPHHPNAWGGLIRRAIKGGYLQRTGEWRSPSSVSSHCRPTSVYTIVK
jgi:hypothetical protein